MDSGKGCYRRLAVLKAARGYERGLDEAVGQTGELEIWRAIIKLCRGQNRFVFERIETE